MRRQRSPDDVSDVLDIGGTGVVGEDRGAPEPSRRGAATPEIRGRVVAGVCALLSVTAIAAVSAGVGGAGDVSVGVAVFGWYRILIAAVTAALLTAGWL